MAAAFLLMTWTVLVLTSVVTSRPVEVRDLTYSLNEQSVFWPGQPTFSFNIILRGHFGASGLWWEANDFGMEEHGGTHIDAPAHFSEGRWRTHQIPPSHLVGPGVVVDMTRQARLDEMYAVTTQDFLNWEEKHGRLPEGAVVLIKFGWGERYPDPLRVFNTDNPDDPSTYRYPGLHANTAQWLVDNRNLTALGVDTPSPDNPNTANFPAHTVLLGNDVLILEYVAYLETLPPRGFDVVIGVIKIEDGSGGPARILGLMNTGNDAVAFRGGFAQICVMAVLLIAWELV
ncbi:hypothetical protein ACOMHN_027928 [Nucella lapillus]